MMIGFCMILEEMKNKVLKYINENKTFRLLYIHQISMLMHRTVNRN
jgi:hypothetical protein